MRRPALVLSPSAYNGKVGLAILCPIRSQVKGYPFEVEIRGGKVSGVVLSDQVKSLDWRVRDAELVAVCDRSPSALKRAAKAYPGVLMTAEGPPR